MKERERHIQQLQKAIKISTQTQREFCQYRHSLWLDERAGGKKDVEGTSTYAHSSNGPQLQLEESRLE
jgi:hypothetical protein